MTENRGDMPSLPEVPQSKYSGPVPTEVRDAPITKEEYDPVRSILEPKLPSVPQEGLILPITRKRLTEEAKVTSNLPPEGLAKIKRHREYVMSWERAEQKPIEKIAHEIACRHVIDKESLGDISETLGKSPQSIATLLRNFGYGAYIRTAREGLRLVHSDEDKKKEIYSKVHTPHARRKKSEAQQRRIQENPEHTLKGLGLEEREEAMRAKIEKAFGKEDPLGEIKRLRAAGRTWVEIEAEVRAKGVDTSAGNIRKRWMPFLSSSSSEK